MFVDASAIVAILAREAGAEALIERIDNAAAPLLTSPVALVEATLGLARAKSGANTGRLEPATIRAALDVVEAFVAANAIEVASLGAETALGAVEAAATWGKLVGHPAALNLGDCFAYACAREHGVSLLYKGDDFARTDLR